jgi:hypothetical protein
MLRRSLALGSCLVASVAVLACQEQSTQPVATATSASPARTGATASPQAYLLTLWADRAPLTLAASVPSVEKVFVESGRQAINRNDYVCSETNSPVVQYMYDELSVTLAKESSLFFSIYNILGDLIPTYEALYFQTSATPQTYGYDGKFTNVIQNTERDVKSFWDIKSSDIQVVAMHGSMLLDTARVARTYRDVFAYSPAVAAANAKTIHDALSASKTMNGGNFAFFTFNAFAFTTFGTEPIPDKIVMGDGILESYAAIGFGDVAPQAIFAHEFGHHIQYEKGYYNDLAANRYSDAERSRYDELMADAFSAYYLTHSRGAAMNQKRVEQFHDVFFQIGDCSFKSDGHHGTPNQRRAAADFGFKLAAAAQKQGQILTSQAFHDLFVAAYPTIIAPDAR